MGCHETKEQAAAQIYAINQSEGKTYQKSYDGCGCETCKELNVSCEDCPVCQSETMKMDCCKNITKADSSYTPTAGMKAAARRALKWKEQGKAKGAGTPVGWGRATDIVAGRSLSLDTVKRMYSFFSRHQVDKKGKDFYNTSNPSNGRIMWDAWGGDAGFTWSKNIVEREANKMWEGSAFSNSSFAKREFSTRQRERMASAGTAMPDGSYPIANRKDLMNAIRSWGRGGADPKVKEHIKSRARALGAEDMIPENWK